MAKVVEYHCASAPYFPREGATSHKAIFEANRHRVYSLAFWMTGSEPGAEQLLEYALQPEVGMPATSRTLCPS